MRPLELTIDGFRSYRAEESFAFEGRTLFGIVGPTGAGKSSILDAIIYALYGKAPQLEKDTRKLINSSAEEARVRLVFEVDGSPWEVTRVIRNKGASQIVLRRYGDDSLEATGATAATNRIVELIGLDFNAFCSSVTLPQGEFDRFLTATTAERTRILKRIFRLERVDAMRELAKTRLGEIQFEVAALEARLESLPEDPQAILDQLRTRLGETKERAEALKDAALEVAGAERELGRVAEEAQRADLRIGELRRISADLPEPAAVQSLWEEEDAARRAVASQQEEREKAAADLKVREEALRRAEAELAPGLTRARELTRDRSRAEDRLKALSGTEEELANAVKSHEQARLAAADAVEKAESELADAARKLLEVHTSHAAHLLRRDLKPGEPCP
ncbi:MAG: AAA family ATPase, partial [Actinomycetota bacterium]